MSTSTAKRIVELVHRRGILRAQLTNFKKFLNNIEEHENQSRIRIRKQKLEEAFSSFEEIQTELEILEPEVDHVATRLDMLENLYDAIANAEDLLSPASTITTINSIDHTNSIPHSSISRTIKLPKLDLPKFDGQYETWLTFQDSFTSMIDQQTGLSNVQKLQYLRSSLVGEAAKVVDSFETTDGNYSEAWNLLKLTYDNHRVITLRHIQLLFELPTLSRESSTDLRRLVNDAQQHIRALKSLGQPVEQWDALLVYILHSKLDKYTRRAWERTFQDTSMPKYDNLLSFLRQAASYTESGSSVSSNQRTHTTSNNFKSPKFISNRHHIRPVQPTNQTFFVDNNKKCPICKASHMIYRCEKFLGQTVADRIKAVKQAALCFNCLRPGHAVPALTLMATIPQHELLVTAYINILNQAGKTILCRALLDTCSSTNFISEHLAKSLLIPMQKCTIPIGGLNNITTATNHIITTTIRSQRNNYQRTLSFLTVPQISRLLPAQQIDRSQLTIPKNIKLADPYFHRPAKVDVLLSAGPTLSTFCVGQINLSRSEGMDLVLQKTVFGWVIGGSVSVTSPNLIAVSHHSTTIPFDMGRFWEVEEASVVTHLTTDELACERHFTENVMRDKTGRYIVALPFNEKLPKLRDSQAAAQRRFKTLERRFQREPEFEKQYSSVIQEYIDLNHMNETSEQHPQNVEFYLPHHAVIKETSVTTKLRVVFDGSAKCSTGVSLNDTLLVGPTIQDKLFSIVLRFRQHNYVLFGDIEKMYRQILVRKEDRRFQKILWRDTTGKLKTYELNTVTFGLACAPFLAIRSLHQLAHDEGHKFPNAANIIKHDLYVDDLMTGAESHAQALRIRDELIQLLKLGGFNMRQWASNDISLTSDLPTDNINLKVQLGADTILKTLGICWNSKFDAIVYNVAPMDSREKSTKRTILSDISRIFDPLGLIGPIVVTAKLIMQKLWLGQLAWDESVPTNLHTEWHNYIGELHMLHQTMIPRRVLIKDHTEIQLHGFCDASERAYGACIYLRSIDSQDRIHTQLLCAKSRVAPLKTVSLPRLELCGAVLLATLYNTVESALSIQINSTIFWSDSTITLHWINSPPHRLKTFVANRVADIQTKTNRAAWRHVRSHDNPADALSRGQLPSEFLENNLWQTGPSWLAAKENHWPEPVIPPINEIPELRRLECLTTTIAPNDLFERYSSIIKLQHLVAYGLRFKLDNKWKGALNVIELEAALHSIIKIIQQRHFSREIEELQKPQTIVIKGKLACLNAFLDQIGMIRVGGRIQNADIPYSQRHPIVLPKSDKVTDMIIRHEHVRNYHAGIQTTLYALRQRYWLIDGRNQIRRVIRRCVRCFRTKPPEVNHIMGQLPKVRVTEARPFYNVGIDYCGPFYIKERKVRNRARIKVYVAVFVCMVVKAVHLEVVSDMTTEGFLAALKRFIARRGKCKNIYSDNGRNFIGANHELKELYTLLHSDNHQARVHGYLNNEAITWHFIPPLSPHFGGLWEAGVKSFKHHLRRVMGNELLTFESFNTCIIEIEAILNSRPLTPLSSDPSDIIVLTPGHFLIGNAMTSLPEHDFTHTTSNRLSTWQHVQKIKQDFWARWHKEYINELNIRRKWNNGQHDLKEGSVVVLKDEHLAPLQWPLGRVLKIHPGTDGIVRVVTVKTATNILDRSVKKVVPLPMEEAPRD